MNFFFFNNLALLCLMTISWLKIFFSYIFLTLISHQVCENLYVNRKRKRARWGNFQYTYIWQKYLIYFKYFFNLPILSNWDVKFFRHHTRNINLFNLSFPFFLLKKGEDHDRMNSEKPTSLEQKRQLNEKRAKRKKIFDSQMNKKKSTFGSISFSVRLSMHAGRQAVVPTWG